MYTRNSCNIKYVSLGWEHNRPTSIAGFCGNISPTSAVKTAKPLMLKASESHGNLRMALLDWRNTASEQLGPSPAQLMFGRRTRTRLPSADVLLSTPSAAAAQSALTAVKERQASYYNRGAKERPHYRSDKPCE